MAKPNNKATEDKVNLHPINKAALHQLQRLKQAPNRKQMHVVELLDYLRYDPELEEGMGYRAADERAMEDHLWKIEVLGTDPEAWERLTEGLEPENLDQVADLLEAARDKQTIKEIILDELVAEGLANYMPAFGARPYIQPVEASI
jgi:hypothetical protein